MSTSDKSHSLFLKYNTIALRRIGDYSFEFPEPIPDWAQILLANTSIGRRYVHFEDEFSFVRNFLIDANAHWKERKQTAISSGVYAEKFENKTHYAEFFAAYLMGEAYLFIEYLGAEAPAGLHEAVRKMRGTKLRLELTTQELTRERDAIQSQRVFLDSLPLLFITVSPLGEVLSLDASDEYKRDGFSENDVGKNIRELFDRDKSIQLLAQIESVATKRTGIAFDIQTHNGLKPRTHHVKVNLVEEGKVVLVFRDTTDSSELQNELMAMAYTDVLTGLPNRQLLNDRIGQAIIRARRSKAMVGLLFVDLDGFKRINDEYGHAFGDALLIEVARKLTSSVRNSDTVVRLGGDEFVVLLEGASTRGEYRDIALKLIEQVAKPHWVEEQALNVTASIGIALFPEDGDDVAGLLASADASMYRAKRQGKNRISDSKTWDKELLPTREAIAKAVDEDQMILVYQPVLNILTNQISSYEALARWPRQKGEQSASAFLPAVQNLNLSEVNDVQLFRKLVEHLKGRQPEEGVSFNVSEAWLKSPGFVDAVLKQNPNANAIALEIDQRTLEHLNLKVKGKLQSLSEAGVGLMMTAFDAEKCSLRALEGFEFVAVKLPLGFIQQYATRGESLKRSVAIAKVFSSKVVALGVETKEQIAQARMLGCTHIQGHAVSKAVSSLYSLE